MKKGWKRFWIGCGAAAGVGAVCCMTGMAMGADVKVMENSIPRWLNLGGIFEGSGAEKMDFVSGEGSDSAEVIGTYRDIQNLDVDVSTLQVQILEEGTKGDEIRVETENIETWTNLKVENEGNTLEISDDVDGWGKILDKNKGYWGCVWVCVPEGFEFAEAEMEIGKADVYAEQIRAKELDVSVDAGNCSIGEFAAEQADFSVDVGTLTAYGDAVKKLELNCDVGSISYTSKGKQGDYNYKLECDVGELTIGEGKYSGLGIEKTVHNGADRIMEISCDVGNVEVFFNEE